MARPRIYVNRHGKPVNEETGVHFSKGRHRFYIILPDDRRQEFRTWEQARAAHCTGMADAIPPQELARIEALGRYRSDLVHERLCSDRDRPDLPTG